MAAQRTRDQALASQLRISTIVALLSTIGAGAAAWFVTRRMLKPITDVTAAARNASAHNLGTRIGHIGPADELAELAETFDEMLARLQRSFESSSRFGSNAAHELKTPLAVIRAELDAHRASPDIGPDEEALLDRLELGVERSDRLVSSLLSLSRAEAGLQFTDVVDLPSITTNALLDHAELLSERGLSVDYQVNDLHHDRLQVQGDPALLSTLVHNLVENAAKYAVTGSEIEVEVGHVDDVLRLRVENRCETIDVDDPMTLIEPFNRGSARVGAGGHGLGLSIVGAVARAHDAPIDVRFRAGSYGLVITIDFDPAPVSGAARSPRQQRSNLNDALPRSVRRSDVKGIDGPA